MRSATRPDGKTAARSAGLRYVDDRRPGISRVGHGAGVSYIHPEVVNAYFDGTLAGTLNRKAGRELRSHLRDLSPEEAAVLALLYRGLELDARRAA